MKVDLNNILISLVIGFVTSLLATYLANSHKIVYFILPLIIISPAIYVLIRFVFPKLRFLKGVDIIGNDSSVYIREMAKCLKKMEKTFIYKGLTGHEFFSNSQLRKSIAESNLHKINSFSCFFTDPNSKAYENEETTISNRNSLLKKHMVCREYLVKVIDEIKDRNKKVTFDVRYYQENKNMLNLVQIDDDAFVFIRGFNKIKGLGNQIVLKINLNKCNPIISSIVDAIFQKFYVVFSYNKNKQNHE